MDEKELQSIASRALLESRRAHEAAHTGVTPCDWGQVARAWERLSDAADALHALMMRRAYYRRSDEAASDETGTAAA
jgi:hypothetical protein